MRPSTGGAYRGTGTRSVLNERYWILEREFAIFISRAKLKLFSQQRTVKVNKKKPSKRFSSCPRTGLYSSYYISNI